METKNKSTTKILEELEKSCQKAGKISLGDLTEKLSDRAFGLLILIFSIMSLIPAASAVFSVPVLIISVQIILGQNKVWLPKWLAQKKFTESHLAATLKKVIPVLKFMEKFIKPRMKFLTTDLVERFVAVIILALALVLFLPLPGFNLIPAIAMCLLALGMLEKDGLLILLGSISSVAGIWLMSFVIIKALAKIFHYIGDQVGSIV